MSAPKQLLLVSIVTLLSACTPTDYHLSDYTKDYVHTPSSDEYSSEETQTEELDPEVLKKFEGVTNLEYLIDRVREPHEQALLAKNKFVVIPSTDREFFPGYEQNRYVYNSNFVTTDAMLHTYHLLFEHVLMKTEEEKLSPLALSISQKMLDKSIAQYNELKGTPWENAAKRNVGFFAVALKQLKPDLVMPEVTNPQTGVELALIEAHSEIAESPLMNIGGMTTREIDTVWGPLTPGAIKEDYTQYIPRGHYDRSETLKRYFKAMMWYGRLTFRLKNPDEVKSAILITKALDDEKARTDWAKLYEITAFFVGESDDLTYQQLKKAVDQVYYETSDLKKMAKDEAKLHLFTKILSELPAPKINSIPVFRAGIEDREQEIKGFRFMGQRFTLDASIMQRLVCKDVGTKDGKEQCGGDIPGSRMLPKGLDVAAAFGSDEALNILKSMGETEYLHYEENMGKLRQLVSGYDVKTWTQNLYWGWLYAIRPLLDVPGENYPEFMKNQAWVRKQLQTFLGSWTELKHDTILYTKQTYAELGGGPPPVQDDRGYVEPAPLTFERLALLSKMTREGLANRSLLTAQQEDNLKRMEELSSRLGAIARKELAGQKITEEDYELIRSFGGQIEHLWYEANKEKIEASGMSQYDYLDQNPAAIVADVATDPNGQVLEEATGRVFDIYVLVTVEGKLKLLNGLVYSYYEFPWPISDRLTDKKWRDMLNESDMSDKPTIPPQPEWTNAFIAN